MKVIVYLCPHQIIKYLKEDILSQSFNKNLPCTLAPASCLVYSSLSHTFSVFTLCHEYYVSPDSFNIKASIHFHLFFSFILTFSSKISLRECLTQPELDSNMCCRDQSKGLVPLWIIKLPWFHATSYPSAVTCSIYNLLRALLTQYISNFDAFQSLTSNYVLQFVDFLKNVLCFGASSLFSTRIFLPYIDNSSSYLLLRSF